MKSIIYATDFEQSQVLSEKDRKLIEKAHEKQSKREKRGKFYVLNGVYPKTCILIAKGKNVKKTIEKALEKLFYKDLLTKQNTKHNENKKQNKRIT